MTTTASRPSSTARIGSHCPAWKSSCPKRSVRIARARVFDTAFGMETGQGRKRTLTRQQRKAVEGSFEGALCLWPRHVVQHAVQVLGCPTQRLHGHAFIVAVHPQ